MRFTIENWSCSLKGSSELHSFHLITSFLMDCCSFFQKIDTNTFPVFFGSRILFFQMQKHNEWLSNKGYLRHMEVLNKISQRKAHSLNRTCPIRQRGTLNDSREHETLENTFMRRDNAIRDQQLLWDNYFLGKRIIQTPPVISKKKMDEEYKRHKMIIQSMAASSSRRTIPTDFRVKKLQEYKENVEQHYQDLAQQTAAHHNFIRIDVKALIFYRDKHVLDNLGLLFVYSTKTGKRHRQSCESFPVCELLERSFYFGISRRLLTTSEPLLLQLRNVKGLELYSIGCISFPSGEELSHYKCQLCHNGKPIGQMQISTAYNKRAC